MEDNLKVLILDGKSVKINDALLHTVDVVEKHGFKFRELSSWFNM